jgi:hypothetical protein
MRYTQQHQTVVIQEEMTPPNKFYTLHTTMTASYLTRVSQLLDVKFGHLYFLHVTI